MACEAEKDRKEEPNRGECARENPARENSARNGGWGKRIEAVFSLVVLFLLALVVYDGIRYKAFFFHALIGVFLAVVFFAFGGARWVTLSLERARKTLFWLILGGGGVLLLLSLGIVLARKFV